MEQKQNNDLPRQIAKQGLGYVRSYNLSIFSLFDLNRGDCAKIIEELEKIDTKYQQTLHIREFCEMFCPKSINIFLLLWDKFWSVYTKKGRISQQLGLQMEIHESSIYRRSSYLDFLSFSFFFMSMGERPSNLLEYIYLFNYSMAGVAPTEDNMLKLAESLWTPINSSKTLRVMRVVKKGLSKFDKRNFRLSRFKVYDWRCKGAFSSPLLELYREIATNMLNRQIWARIISKVQRVSKNPDLYIDVPMLDDKILKGRKRDYRPKGERVYAKKDLQLYLHLLNDYQELLSLELEHDEMFKNKHYLYSVFKENWEIFKLFVTNYILNKILHHKNKIIPTSYVIRKKYKHLLETANEAKDNKANMDDEDEYVFKYIEKGALEIPVQDMHQQAEDAKMKARNIIEKCKQDFEQAALTNAEIEKELYKSKQGVKANDNPDVDIMRTLPVDEKNGEDFGAIDSDDIDSMK